MPEQILIGEVLFSFHTPRQIRWKPEDENFRYRGQHYRREITVDIQMVTQLPLLMLREVYKTVDMHFGLDKNGNEVREYTATYVAGHPKYAVSFLQGDAITVYFLESSSVWDNPNTRIWNLVHMENVLLDADALVLHCSYLEYDGKAILFSAPSGTGKTTQAKLWEKLYPAKIVNGDKAIVQRKNGNWYACGYPFHGSAAECLNEDYPIAAIAVVRQNPRDYIETLHPMQQLQAIYSETTVNAVNPQNVNRTLDLIEDLVSKVTVVCQQCTMEDEACHTLHRYVKENIYGTV